MSWNKKDIIKFIEKNRNLTDVKIDSLLQNWWDRFVYKISSKEWIFVFKLSWEEKTEQNIIKDLYIFDYSERNNFVYLPNLLRTKEDKNYIKYKNRFAFMMEFIDWWEPENNTKNWKEIWKTMAKLHNLKNYKYETGFTPKSEKEIFKQTAKDLPFENEYLKLVNWLPNLDNCSKSVIHSDIWLHNTIQNKEWKIFFIDWDDCWIWITILDLWFPLISIFLNHDLQFDNENAKAFYNSYFENRKLPEEDKNMIFDAALFFVLMYIPYWDKDKNWKRIQFAIKNRDMISSVLN